MADPWDAFGEEDDNDDDDHHNFNPSLSKERDHFDAAISVTTNLTKIWLNQNDISSLQHRRILLLVTTSPADTGLTKSIDIAGEASPSLDDEVKRWKMVFASKKIHDVTLLASNDLAGADYVFFDAIIWLPHPDLEMLDNLQLDNLCATAESTLVPGGYLVFHQPKNSQNEFIGHFSESIWDVYSITTITSNQKSQEWSTIRKWSCKVATETCSWLSIKHSISNERKLLSSATISLSVHERVSGAMNSSSLKKAVDTLQQSGYCIIAGLLCNERETCLEYGAAAMSDLNMASEKLKLQGVNLFEPSLSVQEPGTYRELSMREDCRMDLRHGPKLEKLRGSDGNRSTTYKASDQGDNKNFLRGNYNILSIVRRTMNPPVSKERYVGNYGRYNFDGSGPDGSDRDLVSGPVGAIINLPGSADQAIHADTPHLFEHRISPSPLPPHYINVFTLGCLPMDRVGQTAFIHASHDMDFVADHVRMDSTNDDTRNPFLPSIWTHLVRPQMDLGDVILFDCRILHFGLANQHKFLSRPMLYANMTLHWFHDPKNWDDQMSIFSDGNDGNSQSKVSSCKM